jgi:hypothetical protein
VPAVDRLAGKFKKGGLPMRSILWFLFLILLLASLLATASVTALAATHLDAIHAAGYAAGERVATWHLTPPTFPRPGPLVLLAPFLLG